MPMQRSGRFELLLDLARESSVEKRRELLLRVTDVFLSEPARRTEREGVIFDDIFAAVSRELETQVRAELSRRIAVSTAPLAQTARRLAMDVIEVARPIVERSRALQDSDLFEVIRKKGAEHQVAVTKRQNISAEIADALVKTGSDRVLYSLLENESATISRTTFEQVAERASANRVLHEPFVKHRHVPLDLLNTIYFEVANQLRQEILQRFKSVSPGELEAALQVGRTRISVAYGAVPADFEAASLEVAQLAQNKALGPRAIIDLLREGKRTAFLIAFARVVEIDFGLIQRIVAVPDVDALALLCRSAAFERAVFVALCLAIDKTRPGVGMSEQFGEIYERVPVVAAQRAVRFLKVRAKEAGRAAAA